MYKLFLSELQKIKWRVILLLILLEEVGTWILATGSVKSLVDYFKPNWMTLYFQGVLFHGMFFLPLFTALFAAFLCFYEHKEGSWKQLLTLPYPRWQVILSKILTLIALIAVIQLIYFMGYFIAGKIIGVEGSIPLKIVILRIFGGWLACFPLAVLQIGLACRFKSFGAILTFSISSVVPNIVLTGLPSYIGAWLPFVPPYYAMFPQGLNLSPRVEPVPFILILLVTFLIYFYISIRSFVHKDFM